MSHPLRIISATCRNVPTSRRLPRYSRLDHNLSAAAMVWDKPMEPGQIEPEWQKRFEVIITHGETESLELAKGGFKRIGGGFCDVSVYKFRVD